jgi:hypothetical protein
MLFRIYNTVADPHTVLRIRILLFTLTRIRILPFTLMQILIQLSTSMRIRIRIRNTANDTRQ